MLKDLMGGSGGELRNKADSAGVRVEAGINEASTEIGWRDCGGTDIGKGSLGVGIWMKRLPIGEAHSQLYDPRIWNVVAEAAQTILTSKDWEIIRRRAVAQGADQGEFELEVEERACYLADSAAGACKNRLA